MHIVEQMNYLSSLALTLYQAQISGLKMPIYEASLTRRSDTDFGDPSQVFMHLTGNLNSLNSNPVFHEITHTIWRPMLKKNGNSKELIEMNTETANLKPNKGMNKFVFSPQYECFSWKQPMQMMVRMGRWTTP